MNSYYKLRYTLGHFKKYIAELKDSFVWSRTPNSKLIFSKNELTALKNKFAGKRCFIIGNGPSLNTQNLNLLKDDFTFVTNSFFLKFDELSFRPTFYLVEDHLVAEDNHREINNLENIQKFIPYDLSHILKYTPNTIFLNFKRAYYLKQSSFPQFSTDAEKKVFWGGTVTYLAIELAAHMGFEEIYLIGVDLSYSIPKDALIKGSVITSQSDDPNHFNSSYFGKGKRWHLPRVDRMQIAFSYAYKTLKKQNIKLINATNGGNLQDIPRVNYPDLFK